MDNVKNVSKQQEPMYVEHHNLLCWKSVFAGVIITFMSFMILTALGAGIGGATASSMITNQRNGWGLATGAGLWLGVSMVLSLFLGSYFTLRISKYLTNKVGAAHGFVVASIFFILLMLGAGTTIGGMSSTLANIVGTLGKGASDLSANPAIEDTVQQALTHSGNLKSDPATVVQGLVSRLLTGDMNSVRSYFAYQTGMTPDQVSNATTQLKANFDQTMATIGQAAAKGVADAGWSLFVTFIVGLFGAVIGGRIGAHANAKRPIAEREFEQFGTPVQVSA